MSDQYKYQPLTTNASEAQPVSGNSKWCTIWRVANLVMAVFFTLCAYVQLNDPDPLLWIPLYMVPAALSFAIVVMPTVTDFHAWKIPVVVEIAISLVVTVYTFVLLVEFIAIENPLKYEEGRELAGLLIIIFWMSTCRFTSFGTGNPGKGSAKALLLIASIIGLIPMVLWAMCFVDALTHLGHCKDMFPGMLSRSL